MVLEAQGYAWHWRHFGSGESLVEDGNHNGGVHIEASGQIAKKSQI
jgi:hypothetical protein